MIVPQLTGKVQTVLGLVAPEDLGATLPHEHILVDFSPFFHVQPSTATDKHLASQPIILQNLGWLRMHWEKSLDNLKLLDEETAIDELLLYKRSGGLTIVDVTPKHVARDPLGLTRIAQATGLNTIMGTAYYIAASQGIFHLR